MVRPMTNQQQAIFEVNTRSADYFGSSQTSASSPLQEVRKASPEIGSDMAHSCLCLSSSRKARLISLKFCLKYPLRARGPTLPRDLLRTPEVLLHRRGRIRWGVTHAANLCCSIHLDNGEMVACRSRIVLDRPVTVRCCLLPLNAGIAVRDRPCVGGGTTYIVLRGTACSPRFA
jgi:hypothetical protein